LISPFNLSIGLVERCRKAGMEYTAGIESRRGRSAKLGQRAIGHIDPGAASAHLALSAMCKSLAAQLEQETLPGEI
jgi:dihydroxyacetone kinase